MVIAIIGVLVALLLPAVQAAREAARRTDCQNRLRQIALACQNFHDAKTHFPSASAIYAGTPTMLSYVAQILPFIEQKNLHDLVDDTKHWSAPENDAAEAMPLPSFRCPSQNELELSYNSIIGSQLAEELSNLRVHYHASMGAKFDCPLSSFARYPNSTYTYSGNCSDGGGTANNGLIYPLSEVNLKEVIDGTTNTIIIGELSWDSGPQRFWIIGSSSLTIHASYNYTAKNVRFPFNTAFREPLGSPSSGYDNNDMSFGSLHPAGAHLAMADGSVHFVRQDVDAETVLRPMASRASEEQFESPF